MFHFLLISLQLDCFKLQSSVTYDEQRYNVNFTAVPSKTLVGDELAYCNITMNGQLYDLTILLGDIKFVLPGQTYNNSKKINVRVPCAHDKNCSYVNIQNIQAAMYVMTFTELNVNVTSVIGEYDLQIYNHMDCLGGAILTFDITNNVMDMGYQNKAANCPLDGGRYNFKYTLQGTNITLPFTNQPMSYQITFMNGQLLLDNLIPFPLYPTVFSKSNITAKTNPRDFINDLVEIGPITTKVLPQIPFIIGLIKENKIKSLYQHLLLKSTVQQMDTQQNPIKLDFNITVGYYITKKFNIRQDDCLTNMSILLEGEDLLFKAQYNKQATKCGKKYTDSLGFNYTNISFYLQVIQNEDFTGFYYDQTFTVPNYTIGSDINYDIPCKQPDNCSDFTTFISLYQAFPNISVIIQQVYINNGTPVFRTTYVPTVLTRPHYDLVISMRQNSVCFSYQPSENGISTLYLIFSTLRLQYQFYTQTTQTVYCQESTEQQQNQIKQLIHSNINNKQFASYIGQYHISQASLIIYYIPDGSSVPYFIMLGMFVVISIIAVVLAVFKADFAK